MLSNLFVFHNYIWSGNFLCCGCVLIDVQCIETLCGKYLESVLISLYLILWQFPLPNVVLYATHQENKRLFGFVLRTSGGRVESRQTSICYIFESNNEGEKVLVDGCDFYQL